jgi:hypothetical protein
VMNRRWTPIVRWLAFPLLGLALTLTVASRPAAPAPGKGRGPQTAEASAAQMIDEGRRTFRFDTFGDEAFWGDTLGLHLAIEGANFGGVGPGVSPKTALAVGLKVDVDALPPAVVQALRSGQVNLDDPAVTLALLRANAVLGVTGFFNADGSLRSMGIQCALCHSVVDDSFAPGIGHRLDGWANRDLNVGAIVSLAPNLQPVVDLLNSTGGHLTVADLKAVLGSWGPGKFDAEVFLDGKAANPTQVTNGVVTGTNVPGATLIPPAFGLAGVNLHTWTGWGTVTYWNAFVANLEMHGQGTFFDPRLDDATQFPIAAANKFGHVQTTTDLITPKLGALHFYQLALVAPTPPDGSFDAAAAARGEAVFNGKAKCAMCHVPPLFTEPGWNMHTPDELKIDAFQADRAPDHRYRTSPLKGLFTHSKGGFFHDGRFATLADVVEHYDASGVGNNGAPLGLTPAEKADLVEYLKSL